MSNRLERCVICDAQFKYSNSVKECHKDICDLCREVINDSLFELESLEDEEEGTPLPMYQGDTEQGCSTPPSSNKPLSKTDVGSSDG